MGLPQCTGARAKSCPASPLAPSASLCACEEPGLREGQRFSPRCTGRAEAGTTSRRPQSSALGEQPLCAAPIAVLGSAASYPVPPTLADVSVGSAASYLVPPTLADVGVGSASSYPVPPTLADVGMGSAPSSGPLLSPWVGSQASCHTRDGRTSILRAVDTDTF